VSLDSRAVLARSTAETPDLSVHQGKKERKMGMWTRKTDKRSDSESPEAFVAMNIFQVFRKIRDSRFGLSRLSPRLRVRAARDTARAAVDSQPQMFDVSLPLCDVFGIVHVYVRRLSSCVLRTL